MAQSTRTAEPMKQEPAKPEPQKPKTITYVISRPYSDENAYYHEVGALITVPAGIAVPRDWVDVKVLETRPDAADTEEELQLKAVTKHSKRVRRIKS